MEDENKNVQTVFSIYEPAAPQVGNNPPSYEEIRQGIPGPSVFNIPQTENVVPVSGNIDQTDGNNVDGQFRYKKLHLIYGVLSVVFGCIIMIIDPLLPALFRYPYSNFCTGLFIYISGCCSIHGYKKDNKCSLKASLTFNIFSLLTGFTNYVIGVIMSRAQEQSYYSSWSSQYSCTNFYYNPFSCFNYGTQGFAIFNAAFGFFIWILILWDSTLKCGDICCLKKKENVVMFNPAGYVNPQFTNLAQPNQQIPMPQNFPIPAQYPQQYPPQQYPPQQYPPQQYPPQQNYPGQPPMYNVQPPGYQFQTDYGKNVTMNYPATY